IIGWCLERLSVSRSPFSVSLHAALPISMIFGNWRPAGLMIGASLFGYTRAVELRGGTDSLHALLLVIAVVLVVVAVVQLRGRQRSEEHTSELQSRENIVCRLLLEKTNEL